MGYAEIIAGPIKHTAEDTPIVYSPYVWDQKKVVDCHNSYGDLVLYRDMLIQLRERRSEQKAIQGVFWRERGDSLQNIVVPYTHSALFLASGKSIAFEGFKAVILSGQLREPSVLQLSVSHAPQRLGRVQPGTAVKLGDIWGFVQNHIDGATEVFFWSNALEQFYPLRNPGNLRATATIPRVALAGWGAVALTTRTIIISRKTI